MNETLQVVPTKKRFDGLRKWSGWTKQTIFVIGLWFLFSQLYIVAGTMAFKYYDVQIPAHDYLLIGE